MGGTEEIVQRLAHGSQLLWAAALGGETGGFDFQADTQFEDGHHISQGDYGRRVDAKAAGARGIQHEGADAVTGFHQPGGLQPRNGLAHHGAAHALGLHDGGLGGQLLAALDHAALDLLGELGHQLLRQAAMLAARALLGAWVVHGEGRSG
ncbi:hypothetical protein FQZ97_606660 [compost metagenome]